MKKSIRVSLAAILAAVSVAAFAGGKPDEAAKQQAAPQWPRKPVQVVIPAGAGGDTDFNARTVAKYFEKVTGQPMIVTNMTGGGGSIATSHVKGAPNDGSVALFGHTGQVIVNEVAGLVDYSMDAFEIACIPAIDKGTVFVAGGKAGLSSIKDLVAKAKAAPGTVIYGTELGGYSHLQGLIFQNLSGTQLKIVDSGSASEKITSILGGRIALGSITFGAVKDYQTTGEMVVLAQFNNARNPLLGDIPTFKEQGVDFYMEKPYIIAFPKGTDPAIVKRMSDIQAEIVKMPEYAADLEKGFKQPVSFMPKDEAISFLRKVRDDYMQYKDILRQSKK
jgi:tripartite-type tricarboxylate transporter receptor subunit TctC